MYGSSHAPRETTAKTPNLSSRPLFTSKPQEMMIMLLYRPQTVEYNTFCFRIRRPLLPSSPGRGNPSTRLTIEVDTPSTKRIVVVRRGGVIGVSALLFGVENNDGVRLLQFGIQQQRQWRSSGCATVQSSNIHAVVGFRWTGAG